MTDLEAAADRIARFAYIANSLAIRDAALAELRAVAEAVRERCVQIVEHCFDSEDLRDADPMAVIAAIRALPLEADDGDK